MQYPHIPSPELDVLRKAAKSRPTTTRVDEHLNVITSLLSDSLPELERVIIQATHGPNPLDTASKHLVQAGGKRIRPVTTLLMAKACGGEVRKALPLAAAIELVHTAALLHDDVIDEGEIRRGRAASRVLWGNLVSVLSGNLLLTAALKLIQSANIDETMNDMLETMNSLIRGEVAQLAARERNDLTIEQYFTITRNKTASLFANACRAGARAANASSPVINAATTFGLHMGLAFQIIDDILDLEGLPYEVGKQLGHDLEEGKTTLPLILALQDDHKHLLPLVAAARTGDTTAGSQVASSASVQNACAEARRYARLESEKGCDALKIIPPSRERQLLSDLAHDLTLRHA